MASVTFSLAISLDALSVMHWPLVRERALGWSDDSIDPEDIAVLVHLTTQDGQHIPARRVISELGPVLTGAHLADWPTAHWRISQSKGPQNRIRITITDLPAHRSR
jgi:hypothetical protein